MPRRRIYRQGAARGRSEEHTSELQSRENLVCRLLLEKKKQSSSGADCNEPSMEAPRNGLEDQRWGSHLRGDRLGQRYRPRSPIAGSVLCFFFTERATTEIYTLSLHDALPI